jgi:hypothetical protein
MTDRRGPHRRTEEDSRRKDHPIRELMAFFDLLYESQAGMRYPFNGGRDAKVFKELRETYSDEQIRAFIGAFFEIQDDFIEQSGYSVAVFRGCLPKVIAFIRNGPKAKPNNLAGIAEYLQQRRAANE